jgi:hypothetical protein
MTFIHRNVDLNDGRRNRFDAWETNAATAFGVTIYTGNEAVNNTFAAFSKGNSRTFNAMNPAALCAAWNESPCCDQVVIYAPQISAFVWVIQTIAGNYIIGLAPWWRVINSSGTNWTTWRIPATWFGSAGDSLDYPEVAVGNNYLYMAFNVVSNTQRSHAIGVRIPLGDLYAEGTMRAEFFHARENYWLRPVQSTGESGFFVCNSQSEVRVFRWPERENSIFHFDVVIETIPNVDWPVRTPSGTDWLGPTSKVDFHVYGATRAHSQLWVAWNGARRVSGQAENSFPYPHIGIAVIDLNTRALIEQRYIWNRDYAFAWPSLATNVHGEVGLSCCRGGNKRSPQYCVAMLTGPSKGFVEVTSGLTTGAGGHYTSARTSYPDVENLCGSGFNQVMLRTARRLRERKAPLVNHPHHVIFGSKPPRVQVAFGVEEVRFTQWGR